MATVRWFALRLTGRSSAAGLQWGRRSLSSSNSLRTSDVTAVHHGLFDGLEETPQDPILGLVARFVADKSPRKVNLAQGAYKTAEGTSLLLSSVRKAEEQLIAERGSKDYLGIEGLPAFCDASARFALGNDSAAIAEGRVASLQTLSGTGALRVAADLLAQLVPGEVVVHLPRPSWGNHAKIFQAAGLHVEEYRYIDPASGVTLDFDGMMEDLHGLPKGSTVLLHAAAHNPTGVDPTAAQWDALAALFAERGLMPLFDTAYQGFATGDPTRDGYAVRKFESVGLHPILCQSFAKNMGLYGERVGAIHCIGRTKAEAAALLSNIKQRVIRPNYSSPPRHGAAIAAKVLAEPALRAEWELELGVMAGRIEGMRAALVAELERIDAPGDWTHIVKQIGMFAYTGLSAVQVDSMLAEERIYLTRDGRMSLAGLAPKDVEYVAAAMKRVASTLG